MSWSDFDFINSSIVVWGVVTEPGETTTQVMLVTYVVATMCVCVYAIVSIYHTYIHIRRLLGTNSRLSFSPWIITHVNFTSIFLRTCEASDYYQWTVSDGVGYKAFK